MTMVRETTHELLRSWAVLAEPGLDLPGLDAVQIAGGYGVPGERITTGERLTAAGTADGPRLIEVPSDRVS